MQRLVLQPTAGHAPSEMYLGNTLLEDIPGHEAEYGCTDGATLEECTGSTVGAKSVFQDASTSPFVPYQYGQVSMRTMDSHGGWVSSTRQLMNVVRAVFPPHCGGGKPACLISAASLTALKARDEGVYSSTATSWYGLGLYVNKYGNMWHTGLLGGSTSIMVIANTGYSWAAVFNSRGWSGSADKLMWDATKCVGTSWPSTFTPSDAIEEALPPSWTGWTPRTLNPSKWGDGIPRLFRGGASANCSSSAAGCGDAHKVISGCHIDPEQCCQRLWCC